MPDMYLAEQYWGQCLHVKKDKGKLDFMQCMKGLYVHEYNVDEWLDRRVCLFTWIFKQAADVLFQALPSGSLKNTQLIWRRFCEIKCAGCKANSLIKSFKVSGFKLSYEKR